MIDYQQFCRIKDLQDNQGLQAAQIAKTLGLDPRTVAFWLRQERFRPRKTTPRNSKLDPFKPQIVQMREKYPYSAAQVFQRLRAQGFAGGYSLVKAYVRTVRPKRQPAFLTLAFAPGEGAQADWGSFGSVRVGPTSRRLSFFVMVLCYSRLMYVEFTLSQTMEHFLACHQHAFAVFGGVPPRVMVDNLKSAVLKRTLGEAPVFNPKYAACAEQYGFRIVPCHVGKGNEKGRVENGVGYVKKNFLAGLDLADFSVLAPAVNHWRDTVANVRLHGETRKPPLELWHSEKPYLRPLPLHPFDIATVSQVRASRQFRITLDTNRYSVPAHLAGQTLTLTTSPDRLCLSHQNQLVARHVRSYDRHGDFEDPDHPKPLLEHRKKARDHQLFMRFLALAPQAELYYRQLAQRRLNPHHHVRKIVALSDIYGQEAVARALAEALEYQAFAADYIANLLEQRARFTPEASPLHLTRREDLLDLHLQPPDLSLYQETTPTSDTPVEERMLMAQLTTTLSRTVTADEVEQYLRDVQLAFIATHYGDLATQAAHKQWSHLDSLGHLVEGEALLRRDRATHNRIRLARFPVMKTLDQFRWDWPTQINRAQVQHHFTLRFLRDHMHLIYLGGVGLGKTH